MKTEEPYCLAVVQLAVAVSGVKPLLEAKCTMLASNSSFGCDMQQLCRQDVIIMRFELQNVRFLLQSTIVIHKNCITIIL